MPFKTNVLARHVLAVLLLLFSFTTFAQKTVTGRITSNTDKQPLPGATIQVKGTKVATQTGVDGTFSIKVPKDNSVIAISVVGFERMEIGLSGKTDIGEIPMVQSTSTLNDVVVTGYTAQKKKDITGAVAVVNVKELKSVPGSTAESLLQGQAAGVTVINSGQPGGGSNVRVRGIANLYNVDPLYIIDGVQGSMHDLNVNDIESIQVLKDAGAVAIYGIQGSNGVVIVTTKKGHGKATINYDMFVGTQRPLKDGFKLAGSQNWADVYWLQFYNAGIVPANNWFGQGGPAYAPPTLPAYLAPTPFTTDGTVVNPNYAALQAPATYDIVNNQITKTNLAGTDWFHEIFKPSPITQHTISASYASEKSSYYFSFGYMDDEGTLINTYLKRYSVRANTTFNIKDHIRIGENAYIVYKQNPQISNQNEGNSISLSYRIPPLIPVYDIMGNFAGTHSFTINNSGNPVADQKRQANNIGNDWQINGNMFAEVDFLKNFTIRTSIGGTVENYYYDYFNYTPYENAEGSTSANSFVEGGGYYNTMLWTNTLTYTKAWGDHSLKLLAGTESKNYYARGLQGSEASYFTTNPLYWTLNTGNPATQAVSSMAYAYGGGTNPVQNALYSQFGRLDYAYKDKYLVSGTIRRDQSSIFAGGHQTGTFPSVSLGWRLSQEDFMRNITWLRDLKVRGSWGKSGNLSNVPSTNPYNLFNQSAFNSYYDISGSSTSSVLGFYPSNLGNVGTTWENDILSDVGFDASLGKFDVTFDWFEKKISGLLYTDPIAITGAGGAAAPKINFGSVQNTGIDGAITYHGTINRDWKFDVTATITSYVNKITALPPGVQYYDGFTNAGSNRIGAFTRVEAGHAVGEFFGYQVVGYYKDSTDVAKSPTQSGAAPGNFKYADINHDGKIDANDRTWIGNPNPKFTYGVNLGATYKNFDFSAFFYGSYGSKIFNYVKFWTVFPQVFEGNVQSDLLTNSWTPSNLNPKYPRITNSGSFSNSSVVNSFYIEPGSYLRLKSLNIGYSISPALLKKIGIDKFRIFVQGANLFTITKYSGLDPELQGSNLGDQTNFGIDLGNYPANQKNYNVGVDVTF
ncbi:MAG TPA: TonB-dependent receptor [Puia sp.]|nr:TonB-dependent receptor [Puia sp.]